MQLTRSQIHRLMIIDRELRSGRYPTSTRLAELLDVSDRTIRRDIEILRDSLSAPVEWSPVHNGYHYTEPAYFLPPQTMPEGGLLALLASDQVLGATRRTALEERLRSLIEKLPGVFPEPVTISPQDLEQATASPHPGGLRCDPELFRVLQEGIRDRVTLEVIEPGHGRNGGRWQRIDPYHLVSIDGEWILLARSHRHEDVRAYRPSRLREAKRTEERFLLPQEFDPLHFLMTRFHSLAGDRPVSIKIRFDPSLTKYVTNRTWPSQHLVQYRTDGGVDLTLITGNVDGAIRWVLGWGTGAEVISPPWVQRRLREDVGRILERYSKRRARSSRSPRKAASSRRVYKPPSSSKKSL